MKKLNEGDLVIVIEPMPNWSWLNYHTGDLGIIVRLRNYKYNFRVVEVYFFKSGNIEKVPDHFLSGVPNGDR